MPDLAFIVMLCVVLNVEHYFWGWRDGPEGKSTCHSCRGPEFHSQPLSQAALNCLSLQPSLASADTYTCMAYTHTDIHIKNKNKKLKKKAQQF